MTEAVIIKEKTMPRFIYAGFFERLLAFIIDMIVIGAINRLIQLGLGTEIELYNRLTSYSLVNWIVTLGYFTLLTYFNNGQTLGKMILNLRVISLTSDRLSLSQCVSRETFGRYVQNKILPIYLVIPFTNQKQSIFDMISDTAVVKIDAYNYVSHSL